MTACPSGPANAACIASGPFEPVLPHAVVQRCGAIGVRLRIADQQPPQPGQALDQREVGLVDVPPKAIAAVPTEAGPRSVMDTPNHARAPSSAEDDADDLKARKDGGREAAFRVECVGRDLRSR